MHEREPLHEPARVRREQPRVPGSAAAVQDRPRVRDRLALGRDARRADDRRVLLIVSPYVCVDADGDGDGDGV